MSNKEILEKAIKKINKDYKIGTYYDDMERLSKKELQKVIDNVSEEYTDVDVQIRRKNYVVEIATVDNDKDFMIMTREEYIARYGDERYEEE